MTRLRPAVALLLAALLALGSSVMAVARGQATAAGAVVLCTGEGMVVVAVDLGGNPVGPAHICPDCALSLFAADAPAPPVIARPAAAACALHAAPEAAPPAGRSLAAYHARGPPSLS